MSDVIQHTSAFRTRRFLNWFPMGLTYAFLYMGRYNLTVSKNSLGELMTKEDFGVIFAAGTLVYGVAFLLNGPLVDRLGGRRGILAAALGAGAANLAMGFFIRFMLQSGDPSQVNLRLWMMLLYATNMYFQSFGAVSIVKVNAHWFHVRERGGFSGIFGTMISSGIFFAFTVNGWVLDFVEQMSQGTKATWWVFFAPSFLLFSMFAFEFFVLRDRPGQAGHEDFDTGDASSGEEDDAPLPTLQLMKRIITNPIILVIAGVEFCTGVLRNGVMHWFPFYAKEVWVLPGSHGLMYGDWGTRWVIWAGLFAMGALFFVVATRLKGRARGISIIVGAVLALIPFMVAGGWGGILFVAGVVGANVAGWVSDLFFQSRRAPTAAGLYVLVGICTVGMIFALGSTTNEVSWTDAPGEPFEVGDQVVSIVGTEVDDWSDVTEAVACVPARCEDSAWDVAKCTCATSPKETATNLEVSTGTLTATVIRGGQQQVVEFQDPRPVMRAGDRRKLEAGPKLTLNPWVMGGLVFLLSMGVIGTHGLLSGTATMDFGGRKGAATAVGLIDGAVYLGTALEGVALGYLTMKSWTYWPIFLIPFSIIGTALLTRIWNARPGSKKRAEPKADPQSSAQSG